MNLVQNMGAVIEEISSTHFKSDSFYTDPKLQKIKIEKQKLIITGISLSCIIGFVI